MKVLKAVKPTSEQLIVINDIRPWITLIRGAAGSGKTSTALLRLKFLMAYWSQRVNDRHVAPPIRVLVLTFNRTLRGYIAELAADQAGKAGAVVEIRTFGQWSSELATSHSRLADDDRTRLVQKEGFAIGLDPIFLSDEVDYVLGRFQPDKIDDYITVRREGRGASPSVDSALRRRIISEVIGPYQAIKARRNVVDWNDMAVQLSRERRHAPYHIIIVDETQEFSANQMRAVLNHADDDATITLVMDAAQRIYPRGFTWAEVGVRLDPHSSYLLMENHRNTKQIVAFCRSLLAGLEMTADGIIPSPDNINREGPPPILVPGRFGRQMDYVVEKLKQVRSINQSAAILHARGGGWFNGVRTRLGRARIPFIELTREHDWPKDDAEVALSTMASAKGLEFDHVFVVGLNEELTPHGEGEGDSQMEQYRRLLAMAAGRARQSVMLGYKEDEASALIAYIDRSTYELG
ncbi:MAG: hypothetical protein EXR50_06930 [Dehalococcoidia bacterium]|nr:hypothetical protein [Dehalococcoidia bacterium]